VCLRVFARAGGRTRHSDQVHVVGHEAVAQQRETVEVRILPQQLQIDKPVGIMNKNGLAGLAALGNMVGEIDDHEAGEPWGKRTRKLEAWGKLTLLGRSEPGRFPYWEKNRGTFRLSPYFSTLIIRLTIPTMITRGVGSPMMITGSILVERNQNAVDGIPIRE
jgi:hypothetical protein